MRIGGDLDEKRKKERVDSEAANPDNLGYNKEAGGEVQGYQGLSSNYITRESVSSLSRVIRGTIQVWPSRRASACSFSTLGLNLVLTRGILLAFRGVVHSCIPPTDIGSVPSLSGHAKTYRWRSLPRVRRLRARSFRGKFSDGCCPSITTMDQ